MGPADQARGKGQGPLPASPLAKGQASPKILLARSVEPSVHSTSSLSREAGGPRWMPRGNAIYLEDLQSQERAPEHIWGAREPLGSLGHQFPGWAGFRLGSYRKDMCVEGKHWRVVGALVGRGHSAGIGVTRQSCYGPPGSVGGGLGCATVPYPPSLPDPQPQSPMYYAVRRSPLGLFLSNGTYLYINTLGFLVALLASVSSGLV